MNFNVICRRNITYDSYKKLKKKQGFTLSLGDIARGQIDAQAILRLMEEIEYKRKECRTKECKLNSL